MLIVAFRCALPRTFYHRQKIENEDADYIWRFLAPCNQGLIKCWCGQEPSLQVAPSQVPQLTWIAVGWGTWHQTENFLLFLLYLEGEPLKTQTWIPWTMKPAQKKLQANLVWEVVSIKSMNIAFENIDQLKSRQAHFLSSDMPIVEKPTFFMVQANLILLTCPLKKRLLCCYNLFV